MITRMLLASVLAIGASSFAGCGDGDCPATVAEAASCSANGLTCFNGNASCVCSGGQWSCPIDLPVPGPHDMTTRDLASEHD
jgi:hypothetical protein